MTKYDSVNSREEIIIPNTFYVRYGKRILDVLLSSLAIVVLSPLILIVCLLELKFHGAPVLFASTRPGLNCKSFSMLKFRSMTNKCGEDGLPLSDDERLTKFGILLRKTSIDELPASFSIIKGDMSIIGPRPLLVEYLPLYGSRYIQRHKLRPGLELAILKNKHTEDRFIPGTWREQFENDIYYIQNCSLKLDIQMVIAVIKEVFDASERRTNNTRVPFDGTNFDETRSKEELGIISSFSSINKSVRNEK